MNGETLRRLADRLEVLECEHSEFYAEIQRLRGALENLEMQAVRDVAPGWVSVPAVEWDSIMKRGELEALRP